MSELKERLNIAENIKYSDNIHEFDYIYFKSTRRKHDSGYYIVEIFGYIENEDKYYLLTQISDVIDFFQSRELYANTYCIDIPEPGIFRLFTRRGYKFNIPYFNSSTFTIEVKEK